MSQLKRTKSSHSLASSQKKARKLEIPLVSQGQIDIEKSSEEESIVFNTDDSEGSAMLDDEEIEAYVQLAIQEWLEAHGHTLFQYEMTKFLQKISKEKKPKKKTDSKK